MFRREFIIRDTHRGLLFEDGRFLKVLSAGRYHVTTDNHLRRLFKWPVSDIVVVDIRERELTIKGQEILTADKVAIRVSILVQFQVQDPEAAVLRVTSYEDRIYSDVQLAARRSLAGMTFEEILTNRNRLSEEILQDVQETAASYGVRIGRADVKDLIFPGNLQEVMNRVLQAERVSQAELVEARTRAEKSHIEAKAKSAIDAEKAKAGAEVERLKAESEAESKRIATNAEIQAIHELEKVARAFAENPAMLRLEELRTLRDLSTISTAHLYIDFDHRKKHAKTSDSGPDESHAHP
ncbi:MAG: hypothetical protein MI923_10875 [Phycisphaerales bacterium]|nr:hypothetical protein [Phycisphaerales bacterium]